MKISDFDAYIMEDAKKLKKRRLEILQEAELTSKILEVVNNIEEGSPEYFYRLAITEVHRTMTYLNVAFDFGYLGLDMDDYFTDAEAVDLYKEIIEYMQLIRAGVDSFVEAHPIKSIEGGAADNE